MHRAALALLLAWMALQSGAETRRVEITVCPLRG